MDIKTRIGMAKDAFRKHKELLIGNINLQTKKRMLNHGGWTIMSIQSQDMLVKAGLWMMTCSAFLWRYEPVRRTEKSDDG